MKTRSAKLFIASEEDQMADLKWRVKLVDSQGFFDQKELVKLIGRLSKGHKNPITTSERNKIASMAMSKQFEIDELDQAILFTLKILNKKDGVSDYIAISTDHFLNYELEKGGYSIEEYVEQPGVREKVNRRKKTLEMNYSSLLGVEGLKIRARLALKEIAALFSPNELIPHLVELSPKYLASDFTQRWVANNQYISKYGTNPEDCEEATNNLRKISKSILGDKRKNKKRERPYWKVAFAYDYLTRNISGFRKQLKGEFGEFSDSFFDIFCDIQEVLDPQKSLILSESISSSELALEIMINRGDIKSEKTLREIQPKINKIQERHFNGNILGIASDIMPVVFQFIDIPGTHPELVGHANIFEPIENVEFLGV